MVALGRPGAGEELLTRTGFLDVRRLDVPCAWEFADPPTYARTLASTGPAYEAIQTVGEQAFHDAERQRQEGWMMAAARGVLPNRTPRDTGR